MQRKKIHVARLAALCLSSSVLALSPAMASSFSVGGGTVITTSNDGSGDLTGTGGPFILAPNGGGTSGDVITVTGVSITNTNNSVTGRAMDIGGLNPSMASYSVIAHGNTLQGSDNAGLWIGNNGGTISFDSTGGAANHVSGSLGVMVVNTAAGGNVSIKTGADLITTSGAFAGEVLGGSATGTGTISIDSVGATLAGGGAYGISAVTGGSGAITIGGNGGIASSINVANGTGIYVSSASSIINVTLANTGSIAALNGMYLQGSAVTIDSFGTIAATNIAINASNASSLFLTLEDGSTTTSGSILGTSGDDTVKLVTGARTTGTFFGGAFFDGGGGNNRVILTGSGVGSFSTADALNFAVIEKDGTGTWNLSGGAPGIQGATIFLNGGNIVALRDAVAGNVVSAAGTSFQFAIDTTQTYAGVISGGASVSKTGRGDLTLTEKNTYTGGTTISDSGTLILNAENALPVGGAVTLNDNAILSINGFSQSVGALSSSSAASAIGISSGAQLTTTSAEETNLSSRLSGTGTFVKAGTGTLSLFGSGDSLTINVVGGRLNIWGAHPGSAVSVFSGASLGGAGRVGSVNVANGGTLRPGVSPFSTMRVTGDVALASGATYVSDITPSGIGSMQVGGTASLNGSSLVVNLAPGTYSVDQRFTLMSAAGGVSGTFSSLSTSGVPGVFKGALSYDANDVFLALSPNALSPLLAANATSNQRATANGIDAALAGGATLPGGFMALFGLSGAALGGALNQLTGEIGGDASRSASQALSPYLALLMRTGAGNAGDAHAATIGVPAGMRPAQLRTGAVRIWGAAYGGYSKFGSDAVTGARQLSTDAAGLAVGIETQVSDDLLIGGSLAGAGETFSLAGGMGQGISSDLMAGIYMREALLERGYLSGALVYGSHNVGTVRETTISGTDILKGKFVADDFGGRLEGGYGFGLGDDFALTPYAAFAGESFSSPAYGETALSGTSAFALSYAARQTGLVHSELGARAERDFGMGADSLSAEFHAAWAHQIQDDFVSQARFQSLAGSAFAAAGVALPEDSGLLGLGLNLTSPAGVSGGARVESRFGAGFTAVSGSVSIGYSW